GLAGLGYLAVAASTIRGGPNARLWATALAVPLLCCCLPCWCALGADGVGQGGQTQVVTDQLPAALPSWYVPVIGVWVVAGTLSLLVALVLISLPSAGRYFRRVPVLVYYYPYQPPR